MSVLLAATLALAGCAVLGDVRGLGADAPRDAEGRPLAPGPAAPSTCVTEPLDGVGAPMDAATCHPVHNPPSRRFVEQAVPTLLPTRGYGSIGAVRCSDRMPDPPSSADPSGLYRTSHWTCVGREPEGDHLHLDVLWTPYSGYLLLAAVSRDRSPALTVPDPDDPGLPNPHASEEPQR